MLTPEQIDKLPNRVMDYIEQAEYDIIVDMARRIKEGVSLSGTAGYQMWRLEAMGAQRNKVIETLSTVLNKSQSEVVKSFDEACTESLKYDTRLYQAAGYTPILLAENKALQNLIYAGVRRTNGTFQNLTATTANTATMQFENTLDKAVMKLQSGAFTSQQAIKSGMKELAQSGVASIYYTKTGHVDHMDVAFRRATMTGMAQTVQTVTEKQMEQMGVDLVEVTAHAGARPSHAVWQGGIYSLSGKSRKYRSLKVTTGYGTGSGLGGWNCRHGFYPFIEGVSEKLHSKNELKELNNETVNYNGKEISKYDATQKQRSIERNIRKWKREKYALEAIGEDAIEAASKIRHWQSVQRDFTNQTGLRRDYFRERGGRQIAGKPPKYNSATLSDNKYRLLSSDARKSIRSNEKNIATNKTERMLIYDRQGAFLKSFEGDATSVSLPQRSTMSLKGCIVSHNHPSGKTFSVEDIQTLYSRELAEIRATTKEGTFSLKQPPKWHRDIDKQYKIRKEYEETLRGLQEKYIDLYTKDKVSLKQAEKMWVDETMQIFSKKFGIEYTFEEW